MLSSVSSHLLFSEFLTVRIVLRPLLEFKPPSTRMNHPENSLQSSAWPHIFRSPLLNLASDLRWILQVQLLQVFPTHQPIALHRWLLQMYGIISSITAMSSSILCSSIIQFDYRVALSFRPAHFEHTSRHSRFYSSFTRQHSKGLYCHDPYILRGSP